MKFDELNELLDRAEAEISKHFNYSEAEKISKEVIAKIREDDSQQESGALLARAQLYCGDSLMRQGKIAEAMPYAKSALATAQKFNNKEIEARATGLIGSIYWNQSENMLAMDYIKQAVGLHEKNNNRKGAARNLSNMGGVYLDMQNYVPALECLTRAVGILEEEDDKLSVAITRSKIGGIYSSLGLFEKALEEYTISLLLFEELKAKSWANGMYNAIGAMYYYLGELNHALEYYGKALSTLEELGEPDGVATVLGNIGLVYKDLGEYDNAMEYYGKALSYIEKSGDDNYHGFFFGSIGELYADKSYEGYDAAKAEEYLLKSIAFLEKSGTKRDRSRFCLFLADLYKNEQRWEEAYRYKSKYHELKDEVQNDDAVKLTQKHDVEKNYAVERALAQATNEILSNILPPNITERLLKGEKRIADTHENVSVLFADIVGFTQLSSQLPAGELIDILDIVFTRFDTICKKYGLEKIKTIGDAYMAVCGAPVAVENHAERTALAALEMLEDFSMEQKFSVPINFGFRIGLHSGSVVSGIIGENKYSYDLWGDAVNTASRMESHSEEDKIHVSEEFRNALISTSLNEQPIYFIPRGEVSIKGKGIMNTYFLEKA